MAPCRYSVRSRQFIHVLSIIAFSVGFFGVVIPVLAADFTSPNDGSNHTYYESVSAGTYDFTVDGILSHKYTEWYLNGSWQETDESSLLNGYWDPVYDNYFGSGSHEVTAEVYNGDWNWENYHRWYITVTTTSTTSTTTSTTTSSTTSTTSSTTSTTSSTTSTTSSTTSTTSSTTSTTSSTTTTTMPPCGEYSGDPCSYMDHQEAGDAVYRDYYLFEETGLNVIYRHAGLFYGYKDSILQVLQASGNWNIWWWASHSVHYGDFSGGPGGFINNSSGKTYYGAYSKSSLSSTDRSNIISYAEQMEADTDVDYTMINAIDRDSFIDFPLDVDEIDNTRCDGVVEFCYEKSGEDVWGYYNGYWNITTSDTNLDKHNDMPDAVNGDENDGWDPADPYKELSPRAQFGGFGNTNTKLDPSVPKSPTTFYSIVSGTLGSNGWYKSNVGVSLSAIDDSGIYYMRYKIGSGGSYSTYSSPVTMTSSGTLYFYAKDRAGNYPLYADGVTINIDKDNPTVSITSPCSSSCSSSSSSVTVSGTASDSGGSGLDKVYVYNETNGSDGWDHNVSVGPFAVSGILLDSGSNTIKAKAFDFAGNISSEDTVDVTYSPPTSTTSSTTSTTSSTTSSTTTSTTSSTTSTSSVPTTTTSTTSSTTSTSSVPTTTSSTTSSTTSTSSIPTTTTSTTSSTTSTSSVPTTTSSTTSSTTSTSSVPTTTTSSSVSSTTSSTISTTSTTTSVPGNNPPDQPTLSSPGDGDPDVSLTPELEAGSFFDPDIDDIHGQTQWQVMRQSDDLCILDVTSTSFLTSLSVTQGVLSEDTAYYWKVRFYDNHGAPSVWSEAYSFTTLYTGSDENPQNGIPDDQEVDGGVDLDGDGTADMLQNDIKCVNTVVGNGQIGISINGSATVSSIESIESIDPATIPDTTNKPDDLPLGIVCFKLHVNNEGDTAEVTACHSSLSPGATWYKYDTLNGWQDYSAHATFIGDNKVVLELKDGDYGDADGIANKIIVDPSGFGVAVAPPTTTTIPVTTTTIPNTTVPTTTTVPSDDGGGGGGGGWGCFVGTAASSLSW